LRKLPRFDKNLVLLQLELVLAMPRKLRQEDFLRDVVQDSGRHQKRCLCVAEEHFFSIHGWWKRRAINGPMTLTNRSHMMPSSRRMSIRRQSSID
jgi:hypothetical protein